MNRKRLIAETSAPNAAWAGPPVRETVFLLLESDPAWMVPPTKLCLVWFGLVRGPGPFGKVPTEQGAAVWLTPFHCHPAVGDAAGRRILGSVSGPRMESCRTVRRRLLVCWGAGMERGV